MNKTYYIGLDVHKDSIAIAYAPDGSRMDAVFHGTCGGSNLAAERALHTLAKMFRNGDITKCGSGHASRMPCESAQAYRREPKISSQLSQRQHGQPQEVKAP